MYTRRHFIASAAACVALPLLEGCPTVAQVVQATEGVLTEGETILNTVGQPAWAAAFGAAVNGLKAGYAVWDHSPTSTTGQKVEALLNALVAATASVLTTDPFTQLIDELVGLTDFAIGLFAGVPAAGVTALELSPSNPHVGAVQAPKSYREAKARWNKIVAANPALAGARLQ